MLASVVLLASSVHSSHLGLFTALMVVGVVVGVFGHIIRSRTLIVIGILLIGAVSTYYTLVLEPGGR
jgi:hypothetical protein